MADNFIFRVGILFSGVIVPLKIAVGAQHDGQWMLLYTHFEGTFGRNVLWEFIQVKNEFTHTSQDFSLTKWTRFWRCAI